MTTRTTPTTTRRRRSSGAWWSRTSPVSRPKPSSAGSSAAAARAPARRARCASTASWPRATRSRPTSATWRVIDTPGHAPSHICLYQPERRLLISGDHLLGRVSLYFDTGYTPDPVAEFLDSLGKVENLDARLALSGHGRPFTDVAGHVAANRALIEQRLAAVETALPGDGLRDRPGGLRRALQRRYGQLAPEQDARLAHPPRAARAGASCRRSAGALVDRGLDFPHAHRRATDLGRALLLVRVLPAEDRRGRAQPRPRAGRALPDGPDLRLGHLRRRRQHRAEAQDDRHRVLDQGRARARGDGALHLRRRDHRRAARDARRHARRRHPERARPARRPAAGPDRVDGHRGRPRVLARADRADPRRLRLRDRRRLLPGGPHPRRLGGERPALPARRRSTPARAS